MDCWRANSRARNGRSIDDARCSGTLVNVVVALLGGRIGEAFKKRLAFARKQRWIMGAVFIALGLRLAFAKRS
jgi:threonine/homoserine/homoserine lactone efflux protein